MAGFNINRGEDDRVCMFIPPQSLWPCRRLGHRIQVDFLKGLSLGLGFRVVGFRV